MILRKFPLADSLLAHRHLIFHWHTSIRFTLAHCRTFSDRSQALYGQAFDPASIIGRDVRDWKAHQQTVEKAAPATINQRLVALARFFAWAVKQGVVSEDPTQDVNSIRLPQRQPQGLTPPDLRRLLRAVHGSGHVLVNIYSQCSVIGRSGTSTMRPSRMMITALK